MELYHGSPNKEFTPQFGFGEDRHDYGRGFYLTENLDLAKEWAVCNPNTENGWVHKYTLDCQNLKILDFEKLGIFPWMAEVMKHRDADSSRRYKVLSKKFIEKYGICTSGYDVIRGWRADASYFYITKAFVRDEVDIDILEELFRLGDLGIQYIGIKRRGVMAAYSKAYLDEIVETQGNLFEDINRYVEGIDVKYFIEKYMKGNTRSYIDSAQPYVATMDASELWKYFQKTDNFIPLQGEGIGGFLPNWIGQFYAYYQWYYNTKSSQVIEEVPLDFIIAEYQGLHDLDLESAVKKVGEQVKYA